MAEITLTKRILIWLPQCRSGVVVNHAAVDRVTQALVHSDSDLIADADVEVDEVALVEGIGDPLELVHERLCQSEPSVVGCHSEGGDVAVPVATLGFSHYCWRRRRGEPCQQERGRRVLKRARVHGDGGD